MQTPIPDDPLAVTIQKAVHVSGFSRSEIYRRLADGRLRAVKNGARTLILMDSLRECLDTLPPATFRNRNLQAAS